MDIWTYGRWSVLYLTKPVKVWDWNVVRPIGSLSAPPVDNGGQVRKVPAQIDALSVGPPDVISVALQFRVTINQRSINIPYWNINQL